MSHEARPAVVISVAMQPARIMRCAAGAPPPIAHGTADGVTDAVVVFVGLPTRGERLHRMISPHMFFVVTQCFTHCLLLHLNAAVAEQLRPPPLF